ncbi:MAG TPA: phage tail sheath C-terminal domain-containing protein [Kofleriaceae bacterium]
MSPGVYVEEIDAGPTPIEGVSTSIAGAVGVTAQGPTDGKPILVTSFAEYVRAFGGAVTVDDGIKQGFTGGHFWDFPLSVKGLFDNGGQQLYVRRVFSSGATAASQTLKLGVVSAIMQDAASGATQLKLQHLIGVWNGVANTKLVVGGVKTAITVTAYNSTSNTITLSAPITTPVSAGRDYVEVIAPTAPTSGAFDVSAQAKGAWANGAQVQVLPATPVSLNLLPADGQASASTQIATDATTATDTFAVLSTTGFAANDRVTVTSSGGAIPYTIKAITGTNVQVVDLAGAAVSVLWKANWRVDRVPTAFVAPTPPASATINVWGASQLYVNALVELDDTAHKFYTTVGAIDGKKITLNDTPTGVSLFAGMKLRVIEMQISTTAPVGGGNPAITETLSRLRPADQTPPSDSFIMTAIADTSTLIELSAPATFPSPSLANLLTVDPSLAPPAPNGPSWTVLAGGDDDFGSLSIYDFIGLDNGPGKRTGIQSLADIDEIEIVMAPGMWDADVQSALIQHAETLQYRFAIIDPPPADPTSITLIEDIQSVRAALDSEYAALYWPWIAVLDPFAMESTEIAPSGHMAGIYAQTDNARGVWKAPANVVIAGIDLDNGKNGLQVEITKREQDDLNPNGINALRFFPNRGTRVWGARTISSDESWKYVNVRRLFIYVEASIDQGTQWVVFEPNDESTWARVRQSINAFLITLWKSGGLQGATQDDAFFVRCDNTTMSQDDIDNGRLICVIGIAPVKPAEFVIFRIQQMVATQS